MQDNQQKQLFTELTLEEGAAVSGGATAILGNKSGNDVNYEINGRNETLAAGQEKSYTYSFLPPTVKFDAKIGPGVEMVTTNLREGTNNFDLTARGRLTLGGGFNNFG